MPVLDGIFADPPAELDLFAVAEAGEVQQPEIEILHDDADRVELANGIGCLLGELLELALRSLQVGRRVARRQQAEGDEGDQQGDERDPQRYPRAGDQSYPSPAAEPSADGSTMVYFAPTQPTGVKRGNWIQTTPGRGWFTILRFYSPLQPFFDKTWQPSEVELVK